MSGGVLDQLRAFKPGVRVRHREYGTGIVQATRCRSQRTEQAKIEGDGVPLGASMIVQVATMFGGHTVHVPGAELELRDTPVVDESDEYAGEREPGDACRHEPPCPPGDEGCGDRRAAKRAMFTDAEEDSAA